MRRKLLIITPSTQGGGRERMSCKIALGINKTLFDTTLLVTHDNAVSDEIQSHINVHCWGASSSKQVFLRLFSFMRHHKPDIVLSMGRSASAILALLKPFLPKCTLLYREITLVSQQRIRTIGEYWIYRLLLAKMDTIICQSLGMKTDILKHFPYVRPEQLHVINNFINPAEINTKLSEIPPASVTAGPTILAVARLSPEKGLKDLINAFAHLPTNTQLYILGDGPEKEALMAQIKTHDLTDRVHFMGFAKNPFPYYQAANLLVMTSVYEGFPNVAIESIYVGTPVVSYDSLGGIHEIIQEGRNGFLVRERCVQLLSQKIMQALSMTWDAKAMRDDLVARFGQDHIMKQYEALLNDPGA